MSLARPDVTYLIFTDLDGTLLDHQTYSFDAAKPTIDKLIKAGHVIIANTSKTQAEISKFQKTAGLKNPFIFENGAAAAIPNGFFPEEISYLTQQYDCGIKSFVKHRNYWLELLQKTAAKYADDYVGFSQMTTEQVVKLTGLATADAELAMQRQFGEPLRWLGSDESYQQFVALMQNTGATVLQGGRFTHICGHTDKGKAMQWLTAIFQQQFPTRQFITIALGDSGNDTAMLQAADIAIQIRNPHHPFPKIRKEKQLFQSTLCGPAGWSECLQQIVFNQEL